MALQQSAPKTRGVAMFLVDGVTNPYRRSRLGTRGGGGTGYRRSRLGTRGGARPLLRPLLVISAGA